MRCYDPCPFYTGFSGKRASFGLDSKEKASDRHAGSVFKKN